MFVCVCACCVCIYIYTERERERERERKCVCVYHSDPFTLYKPHLSSGLSGAVSLTAGALGPSTVSDEYE